MSGKDVLARAVTPSILCGKVAINLLVHIHICLYYKNQSVDIWSLIVPLLVMLKAL